MAKPIANFGFEPGGLSVKFTDSSSGVPTSWSWDFGFKDGDPPVQKTSSVQNPDTIQFPTEGVYKITLVVSNDEGNSDPYTFSIVVSEEPVLALTIAEQVQCSIPMGLAVDTKCFRNSIQKWQLFLQNMVSPKILDADVFNEAKWPTLVNVLISKLIIYDIVMDAAKSSMAAFYIAMKMLNSNNQTTSTTTQVADFTYLLQGGILQTGESLVFNNIVIDGVNTSPSPVLTTNTAMLNYLNTLGVGHFFLEGDNIKVLATNRLLTSISLTYTLNGGGTEAFNGAFVMSNVRVVPINNVIEINGEDFAGNIAMGPLKYIETGPSKTEWYDASTFWSSMFKSVPGTSDLPGSGGIFENIVKDICMWAAKLRIRLPMCPKLSSPNVPFLIGNKSKGCGCNFNIYGTDKPASRGPVC